MKATNHPPLLFDKLKDREGVRAFPEPDPGGRARAGGVPARVGRGSDVTERIRSADAPRGPEGVAEAASAPVDTAAWAL